MTVTDPYGTFNFLIEVEGLVIGGFTECSGLQVENELFEYREGGLNEYMHCFVGPVKYMPIVLKRGITSSEGLWQWHQDVIKHGITRALERRNGTIYLLGPHKNPAKAWNFMQAFPYKWTGPELRADSSDVAFESVELAHQGLNQVPV